MKINCIRLGRKLEILSNTDLYFIIYVIFILNPYLSVKIDIKQIKY